MLKRFLPKDYKPTVFEIPFDRLYEQGYRGLIFDIDNTLSPNNIPEPTDDIINLMQHLKELGYKICLLSNNNEGRVELFNKKLNLFTVPNANKPGLGGMEKALKLMETAVTHTILVGDQIFTDMWCGNRIGMHTILVEPLSLTEEVLIRLKRFLEKPVMAKYKRIQKKNR